MVNNQQQIPSSQPSSSTITVSANIEQTITSQTFNYTGNNQTFIVPSGCGIIEVKLWGGGGGGASGGTENFGGGSGGYSTCFLEVTSSETLNLIVGGGGNAI